MLQLELLLRYRDVLSQSHDPRLIFRTIPYNDAQITDMSLCRDSLHRRVCIYHLWTGHILLPQHPGQLVNGGGSLLDFQLAFGLAD
jgi:hypothetical protein